MIRKISATAVAVVWACVVLTTPAWASCVVDPNISFRERMDQGVAVFVGMVNNTTNYGRTATVTVQEIWRAGDLAGPDGSLPPHVTVDGSGSTDAATPAPSSSIDRHYKNTVYLFVPESGGRESEDELHFGENACSATTEFTTGVEKYRPANVSPAAFARAPEAPPGAPDRERWVIGGIVAAAVLAAVYALARRRNARPTA